MTNESIAKIRLKRTNFKMFVLFILPIDKIITDLSNIKSFGGFNMRKIVNGLMNKGVFGALNCLALSVAVLNAQQCCFWFIHQPKFPAEADKFRKFK